MSATTGAIMWLHAVSGALGAGHWQLLPYPDLAACRAAVPEARERAAYEGLQGVTLDCREVKERSS